MDLQLLERWAFNPRDIQFFCAGACALCRLEPSVEMRHHFKPERADDAQYMEAWPRSGDWTWSNQLSSDLVEYEKALETGSLWEVSTVGDRVRDICRSRLMAKSRTDVYAKVVVTLEDRAEKARADELGALDDALVLMSAMYIALGKRRRNHNHLVMRLRTQPTFEQVRALAFSSSSIQAKLLDEQLEPAHVEAVRDKAQMYVEPGGFEHGRLLTMVEPLIRARWSSRGLYVLPRNWLRALEVPAGAWVTMKHPGDTAQVVETALLLRGENAETLTGSFRLARKLEA